MKNELQKVEFIRSVSRNLISRGFKVDTATNGADTLERLEQGGIDVLVTELVMTSMSV